MSAPHPTAAGWYPDRSAPSALRWWTGREWGSAVRAAVPVQGPLPEGAPVLGAYIWVLALLPVVALIGTWVSPGLTFRSSYSGAAGGDATMEPSFGFSAHLAPPSLLWLLTYALGVVIAALDVRHLRGAGYTRPFHGRSPSSPSSGSM